MVVASCYMKIVSNYTQGINDKGKHLKNETRNIIRSKIVGRRGVILYSSSSTILLATISAFSSNDNDSKTALLQKYLKKSQENKTKYDKERLDNYYKRNYKDYFGFVEGTLRAKEEKQLSESEKGILQWLDKNK